MCLKVENININLECHLGIGLKSCLVIFKLIPLHLHFNMRNLYSLVQDNKCMTIGGTQKFVKKVSAGNITFLAVYQEVLMCLRILKCVVCL